MADGQELFTAASAQYAVVTQLAAKRAEAAKTRQETITAADAARDQAVKAADAAYASVVQAHEAALANLKALQSELQGILGTVQTADSWRFRQG